ncbi:MAG: hypothetical protein ACI8TQ_002102 [Planctomycetota bacterium]|jgi:hypothetical protein
MRIGQFEQVTPGRAVQIICTPTTIKIDRTGPKHSKNPIAEAIEAAAPGCTITLKAGEYPSFSIGFSKKNASNARTTGGFPGQPITVTGEGKVWIRPGKDQADTIAVNQQIRNGNFVFKNLMIEPGYRAGIIFYKQGGPETHDNFQFLDCHILGSWGHDTNKGKRSKWGLWGHNMNNFEFRGLSAPARVQNVQQEHGFYIQNPQGPILIENVHGARLGRTFVQFTARAKDGLPGIGTITVRNCVVEDIGLFKDDNHKGGTAFTFAGRLQGDILVENNSYRAGFTPALARLTRPGVPYSTGALVCWTDDGKSKNGTVTIKDNDFEFAKGCGDRPVVSVGGCDRVAIVGSNRFVAGGKHPVLSIDPPRGEPGTRPNSPPIGAIYIDPQTVMQGNVHADGRPISPEKLKALQTPPKREKKTKRR